MAIFKCKMCGGALEINNNETVATCEYCGTQQTLPRLDDDRKANLYDRANHFRRNNEFDKAMGIYEQILNEDGTDAEAYWSLVLCRYGIEYVEDPSTRRRIPTVNRAQFTSVFDDEDYKSALQYADGHQRNVYEKEANAINEIQKGILAISSQEKPFDIFICYKETDNNGRRTPDSVLANDLYHQLTQEGFKVFFARITLEDKLGSAYEPYIFAALNSAKVMVVLGTKPEYFNAVWVKNEWSRYLALIKNGAKKMLIPAYRDMDPYDLPEEFSHLQAQDMSKLGFMQDLIRGIKKIVEADAPKQIVYETTVSNDMASGNVTALLKRGFMALEDGEWSKADDFFEQCLNQNAELAEAYLGKLMAELQVKTQDELKDCDESFEDSSNYLRAIRFSNDKLKASLIGCIKHINTRNENIYLDSIYNDAKNIMATANTEDEYNEAANMFESIYEYKDSASLVSYCYKKAEETRKDKILFEATEMMTGESIFNYKSAIKLFESIAGWKDADEKASRCKKMMAEIRAQNEAVRLERKRQAEINREKAAQIAKRNKKIATIAAPIVCAIIVFLIILSTVIIPSAKYNKAIALADAENYDEAYSVFYELGNYKDSADKAAAVQLQKTKERLKNVEFGDCIKFGTYEQDNDASNGKENIEWLVLEVKDGKFLVISKRALDCKKYNTNFTNVTWETCSLRKWLNGDFWDSSFAACEKSLIAMTTVSADKNPESNTNPGNSTQDKVFLLSIAEVNKYFGSDSERQCQPTSYAIFNGAYVSNSIGHWWLRTPGYSQNLATGVYSGGSCDEYGDYVNSDDVAVRPAMWIDLGLAK